jgi:hypothetical protein
MLEQSTSESFKYYDLAEGAGRNLEINDSVRINTVLKKCYLLRQNHEPQNAMKVAQKVINEVLVIPGK